MKTTLTFLSKKTRTSAMIIAVLGIAAGFTSCKTDVDEPRPIAGLSVLNASPTTGPLYVHIDNQKISTKALPFGFGYGYVYPYAGTVATKVVDSATNNTLYTENITLPSGKYNSLYITKQNETVSYTLFSDDFKETSGKAQIRFINMSSDSPALNLVLEGDTTTFNNRTFKAATAFKNVAPAKYNLSLKNTATGTVVATLADVTLAKDKNYTIWAKGLSTTAVDAQKLGIKVSLHQ